jgi:hypothetical protein
VISRRTCKCLHSSLSMSISFWKLHRGHCALNHYKTRGHSSLSGKCVIISSCAENYFMSNFSFTVQNMLIPSCSRSCGTVKFRVPDYLARSRCKEVNFSFPRKTKFVCPRLFYSCRINENNDTTALCFNLLKVNFDGPDLKLTANFSVSESLATYEEINITGNQGRNIANLS